MGRVGMVRDASRPRQAPDARRDFARGRGRPDRVGEVLHGACRRRRGRHRWRDPRDLRAARSGPMIVVVGATGTLGREVIPLLAASDLPVRVVTRDRAAAAQKLTGVELVEADVARPEEARRAVEGAQAVVSMMTGFASPAGVRKVDFEANRTLAQAAAAAGVEHFVLLSVAQAAADHPIELFRMKHAAEEAVRATGLAFTIIRPTAYLETWLGLIGGPLVTTGKTRLFGRGRNPINFVSAADVARFVDLALTDPTMRGQVVTVPGPDNLTLEDLVDATRRATGVTGTLSRAPLPMLKVLSVGLRPINRVVAGMMATAAVMDTRDMTGNGQAIRAAFPQVPMTTVDQVAGRLFAPAVRRVDERALDGNAAR